MQRVVGAVLLAGLAWGCGAPAADEGPGAPVVPEEPCPPGTMRSTVAPECIPVGPGAMPDGFAPHASGWGWEIVRPVAACAGTEMARIGNANCVAVDDCAAPFPPAGAHAVVGPAELAAALASAPSGALIALDSGDYAAIGLDKDVQLVGRCAAQVVVRGPVTNDPSVIGVSIGSGANVALRSLSIAGFGIGVDIESAGAVTLESVVLTDNRGGIRAVGPSTKLTLARSVVEGPAPIGDAVGVAAFYGASATLTEVDVRRQNRALSANFEGTELVVSRSLVAFEQEPPYAAGIEAWAGAHARVEESGFFTTSGRLIGVGRVLGSTPDQQAPPANVDVVRSVLTQSGLSRDEHSAIDIYDGAGLAFEDVSLRHQSFTAVGVSFAESQLTLTRSLIAAEPAPAPNRSAVIVHDGGKVELTETAIVGAQQTALNANGTGSALHVERSLVTGTLHRFLGDFSFPGGSGQAIGVGDGAELVSIDSALVENDAIGVFGVGSARLRLVRSLIESTRSVPETPLGVGVLVMSSALEMDASVIRRSADTALTFDASAGMVITSTLYDNDVGVRTLGGTELVQVSSAPASVEVGKAVLYDTRFDDNAAASSTAPLGSH